VDDRTVVVGVAVVVILGTGLAAVVVRPLLVRASVRRTLGAVSLAALLGSVVGLLAAAQAMLLSAGAFKVVLAVTAGAALVSLGVARWLAAPFVRGTDALREAARELGVSGTYRAPEGLSTSELRDVSEELRRASALLAQGRERERTMQRSRSELIAWVSHDLRTPMAGVRAMTEALEDGLAADPDLYHRQIRAEVDKMSKLVDDLFTVSRLHAVSLSLHRSITTVTDLVSDALAAAEPQAAARGVDLSGEVEPALQLDADVREIGRVLANLLDNAVRHTPAGGCVRVEGRAEEDRVVLGVSDECGGIPPASLGRVFETAWRANDARTPESEAHGGLGLAIVHGIVTAHGGRVTVANRGPGCRFEVRLPSA
jgi:signal transduction histidine kinase